MASVSEIRTYLSYWFQLGKPVVFEKAQAQCLPQPIFRGSDFSDAFEQCWQQIVQNPTDCHLLGTEQTIAQLLAENWEIMDCARCTMPVPMPVKALSPGLCPCADLPTWPNDDVPQPRLPATNSVQLGSIRDRLRGAYNRSASLPQPGADAAATSPESQTTNASDA